MTNTFQDVPGSPRASEKGQAVLIIVIILAVFLLGALGLATDYAQIWAKRQTAQAAADAACQAGAYDLFLQYQRPDVSTAYPVVNFGWIGTDFDCSTNTSSPPCLYAATNGYSGSQVSVSFPASDSGICPALASSFGTIAHPCMKVTVTDPVQMSFARIITHTATVNTGASAACGLSPVAVPVPLVVLHQTAASSLDRNGGGSIIIFGGPNRSIQVDSSSTSAITPASGGSGTIDLHLAGPNNTGADIGVFGQEAKPTNINFGTSGNWISPGGPLGDPWVTVSEPGSVPPNNGGVAPVTFGTNGCPDPIGCAEFSGGNYSGSCLTGNSITYTSTTTPLNACLVLPITIKLNDRTKNNNYNTLNEVIRPTDHNPGNYAFKVTATGHSVNTNNTSFPQAPAVPAGPNWPQTLGATQTDGTLTWTNIGQFPVGGGGQVNTLGLNTSIFDPGLYYIGAEGIQLGSGTTVRQSTATGDGNRGTTFFFSSNAGTGQNKGTINVGSNTGSTAGCPTGTVSVTGCVASYKPDGSNQTVAGVTVASPAMKCPGGANIPSQVPTTVDGNILMGPCSGTYGSSGGTDRGFLFFQKRSTAVSAQWTGGGKFLLSGFMYFHNTTSYGSTLQLAGNASGGSYTLGNVVADKVQVSGSSSINMILNPAATFEILRPQLLR